MKRDIRCSSPSTGPLRSNDCGSITPDVILLDAVMPGMDGFQTCRAIKEDPATRDIPVIFMTALVDSEHVVRGFTEGAIDYVTKPVRQQEVMARISAHVNKNRLLHKAQKSIDACGKASATLDHRGNFTWQSQRAREWLQEYCEAGGPGVKGPPAHLDQRRGGGPLCAAGSRRRTFASPGRGRGSTSITLARCSAASA